MWPQVSVVDAANFLRSISQSAGGEEVDKSRLVQSDLVNLLVEQVEFANVVILNKVDLVTEQERGKLLAILAKLNPGARILEAQHCVVPLQEVLNTCRYALPAIKTTCKHRLTTWKMQMPQTWPSYT